MNLLVVGAGGHGQVVADIIRARQSAGEVVRFVGYLDDNVQELDDAQRSAVLGSIRDWPGIEHDALVLAIGDNARRARVFVDLSSQGARFASARHPSSIIAPDVSIGAGAVCCAGVVINTQAVIGGNAIINTSSSIDHHCIIGDHAHIAPGVCLGGEVHVGEGALVGIGAIVLPRTRVGAWAVVGAGAVVTEDVRERTIVVGVPARVMSQL